MFDLVKRLLPKGKGKKSNIVDLDIFLSKGFKLTPLPLNMSMVQPSLKKKLILFKFEKITRKKMTYSPHQFLEKRKTLDFLIYLKIFKGDNILIFKFFSKPKNTNKLFSTSHLSIPFFLTFED